MESKDDSLDITAPEDQLDQLQIRPDLMMVGHLEENLCATRRTGQRINAKPAQDTLSSGT